MPKLKAVEKPETYTRPDGWTMHLNVEAHGKYMADFQAGQEADYARTKVVPSCYTRPDGSPYPMDVDKKTYEKIAGSKKLCLWGEGNMPPKGKQGTNGWTSR